MHQFSQQFISDGVVFDLVLQMIMLHPDNEHIFEWVYRIWNKAVICSDIYAVYKSKYALPEQTTEDENEQKKNDEVGDEKTFASWSF